MFITAALACIGLQRAVLATPSGLDNIPTADTPPDKVVVLQAYDTFGESAEHNFSAGVKFGLRPWGNQGWAPRFEGGLDGHLFPGDSGPAIFQGKVTLHPWEQAPAVALGSANIALSASDRDRTGEPFNYLVFSHDLNLLRLHAGYAIQTHNNAGFFGVDTTFPVLSRDLTLRADAIQINDQSQWLTSVGMMYPLTRSLVLEAWTSIPVDGGVANFTLKLDWVLGN
jgi:hypothetical protein